MGFDVATLSRAIASFGIGIGLFLLVLALSIQDHSRFRLNWRTGMVVGFVLFLLMLPLQVFALTRAPAQVAATLARVPNADPQAARAMVYIALVVGFTVSVLSIPWHMLVYHAAAEQWDPLRPQPFPLLQRTGRTPWRAIGGAAAFGVAAGVVSAVIFKLLGVGLPDALKRYGALQASTGNASLAVRLPIAALAVVAVALAEELTYRGVLFGWLQRGLKGRSGMVAAAVITSGVWAAAHLPNTDAPSVKCAQIFVLGLFFCWFARRWCLEAAIAAHACLNVAALLMGAAIF